MKSKDKIEVEELTDPLSENDNRLLALVSIGILDLCMNASERAQDIFMETMRKSLVLYDKQKKKDQS